MKPMYFQLGQDNIDSIFWEDGQVAVGEGRGKVDRISVVLENGQMAEVPWFACWKDGKVIGKYNGAQLQGVHFKD